MVMNWSRCNYSINYGRFLNLLILLRDSANLVECCPSMLRLCMKSFFPENLFLVYRPFAEPPYPSLSLSISWNYIFCTSFTAFVYAEHDSEDFPHLLAAVFLQNVIFPSIICRENLPLFNDTGE